MGSAFHQLCPRYSGSLTPTAPTAIRLWETFTFLQWELITGNATVNLVSEQEQGCAETTVAKGAELLQLKQFNTYEEMKNCGQFTLSTR